MFSLIVVLLFSFLHRPAVDSYLQSKHNIRPPDPSSPAHGRRLGSSFSFSSLLPSSTSSGEEEGDTVIVGDEEREDILYGLAHGRERSAENQFSAEDEREMEGNEGEDTFVLKSNFSLLTEEESDSSDNDGR